MIFVTSARLADRFRVGLIPFIHMAKRTISVELQFHDF